MDATGFPSNFTGLLPARLEPLPMGFSNLPDRLCLRRNNKLDDNRNTRGHGVRRDERCCVGVDKNVEKPNVRADKPPRTPSVERYDVVCLTYILTCDVFLVQTNVTFLPVLLHRFVDHRTRSWRSVRSFQSVKTQDWQPQTVATHTPMGYTVGSSGSPTKAHRLTSRKGSFSEHERANMPPSLFLRSWLHLAFVGLALFLLSWRIHWALTPPEEFEFKEPQLTPDESLKAPRIPRIIHQSYKTSELPPVWADTPARWKSSNPDFEYMFWSDEDNRNLIATDYPWFLETYDSYRYPIQRADSARYFAVLKHGGIYADLDILPLKDVSPLLDWLSSKEHRGKEMLVAQTYNLGLTNALFAAVPNSEVLNEFVRSLPHHRHPFGGFEFVLPHFGILLSTGPTRFWIFLNTCRDKIVTLAPSGWGQCHQCRRQAGGGQPGQCTVQESSYFETTKGGSWHKWDTVFMNFILCFPQFFTWLVCGALVLVGRWIVTTRCAKARGNEAYLDDHDTLPLVKRESRKSLMNVKKNRRVPCWRRLQANLKRFRDLPTLTHHMTQQKEIILYFAVLLALRVI